MKKNGAPFFLTFLLLVLPGCAKKFTSISKQKKAADPKAAYFFDIQVSNNIDISQTIDPLLFQAKLFDIPIMLGSYLLHSENSLAEHQLMMGWLCQHEKELISDYYQKEMIAKGWKLISWIPGYEIMILFQKPKRVCVVIIRPLIRRSNLPFESFIQLVVSNKN